MKGLKHLTLALGILISVSGWCLPPQIEQLLQFRFELYDGLDGVESFIPKKFLTARQLNLLNEIYRKQAPVYEKVLNSEVGTLTEAVSKIMVLDHLAYLYITVENNGQLRRILNEQDQGYDKEKNSYRHLVKKAFSKDMLAKVQRSEDLFKVYQNNKSVEVQEMLSVLKYSFLVGATEHKLKVKRKLFSHFIADGFVKGARGTLYGLSKFFGNTAGRFQSRHGLLYGDKVLEEKLANTLQPLDVLLEKTPFRLTDRFIPGHWGHAAIYVGNKEQLTALGLWNHPAVVPHQERIEAGAVIVEALRPGVQINSIAHFLEIDDLAVQRYKVPMTLEAKQDYLIRTFKQIGKKYDFAFDAESGKTIVCSELPYLIFKDVNFEVSKAMGRPNISPDQISLMSLGEKAEFTLELFIHDGKEITENPEELLGSFLSKK